MFPLLKGGDYTTKGIARICKDGVDSICTGVGAGGTGHVIRERVQKANGQFGVIKYTLSRSRLRHRNLDGKIQFRQIQSWIILFWET